MSARKAKTQFKSKHRMLLDFVGTIGETPSSVAASVAKRHFHQFYPQFVSAYEALLDLSTEELSEDELNIIQVQFSEVNKLMIKLDQASESGRSDSDVKVHHHQNQVMAKLPLIELPKFSGNVMEWPSFYDLFQSLVHGRDISDSEKHYYLRTSLSGDALSIVRQLPIDDQNYSVALQLLRDRYQNQRLLLDTYISRIINLPTIQDNVSLRSEFYDPLRETIQALEKLEKPVKEWSYIILYLVLQKLPVQIRSTFEERYGNSSQILPTIHQLLELLDEQCRVHFTVSTVPDSSVKHEQRSSGIRGRQAPSTSRPFTPQSRGVLPVQAATSSSHQVTSLTCSFCGNQTHTLYKCTDFLKMSRGARKSWAMKSGHCFKCLRKHYASECTHTNWCQHCKSKDHNSLLCNVGSGVKPLTSSQVRQPSQRQSPDRPINQMTTEDQRGPSAASESQSRYYETPPVQSLASHYPHPRVGDRARYAQARFESLRFGSQLSPNENQ